MTYVSPVMIAEAFFSRFEGILDTHIKVLIKTQLHVQRPYLIKCNLTTANLNFAFIVQDNVPLNLVRKFGLLPRVSHVILET